MYNEQQGIWRSIIYPFTCVVCLFVAGLQYPVAGFSLIIVLFLLNLKSITSILRGWQLFRVVASLFVFLFPLIVDPFGPPANFSIVWLPFCFIAYLAGAMIKKDAKFFPYYVGASALGGCLFSLLSIAKTNMVNGEYLFSVVFGRVLKSVWDVNGKELNATNFGVCLLLGACCCGYIFACRRNNERIWLGVISGVSSIGAAMIITRTPLIAFLVSLILSIFLYSIATRKAPTRIFAVIIFICAIGWLLFDNYLGDLYLAMIEREKSGRLDNWISSLDQIVWRHQFGGQLINFPPNVYYAHNFWIDFANCYGLFLGIGLFVFHVLVIFPQISTRDYLLVVPPVVYVVVSSMVEPLVFYPAMTLLNHFLICGLIASFNRRGCE